MQIKHLKHDFMSLIGYSINDYDKVFLNRDKVELDLIDSKVLSRHMTMS